MIDERQTEAERRAQTAAIQRTFLIALLLVAILFDLMRESMGDRWTLSLFVYGLAVLKFVHVWQRIE